jgi:hypothetical protein
LRASPVRASRANSCSKKRSMTWGSITTRFARGQHGTDMSRSPCSRLRGWHRHGSTSLRRRTRRRPRRASARRGGSTPRHARALVDLRNASADAAGVGAASA